MTFKYLFRPMSLNRARANAINVSTACLSTVGLNSINLNTSNKDNEKSYKNQSYKINPFRSCLSSFSFAMAFTLPFAITTATPLFFSIALSISTPQIALAEVPPPTQETLADTSSQNTQISPLDTTHWITYPVGRYLIDLPPSAKIYWHPLRFSSQYDLVWKKDMTIEEGRALLMQEAEEAKEAPHKSGKSQFINMYTDVGINKKSILLLRYPNEFSSSYLMKTYFINRRLLDKNINKKRRVYYYEEKALDVDNSVNETIGFINYMMYNLISTYPTYPTQPISVNHGTYFEGGLFFGPGPAPYPAHEEIGIEVTFAEFPGIQFSIFFDHLNLDTNSIFRHISPYGDGMLRKAETTIDGNPAEEVLRKFTQNGITHYSFSLNGPSTRAKERINQIPIILMHLKNPIDGVVRNGVETMPPTLKRPSFKSDEEAIAFWDALRRNIRWRPDNWKVHGGPEKQYYLVGGKIIPYMLPMYKGKPQ